MASFEVKDMLSALTRKGFVERETGGKDHKFFDFVYDGKLTGISTKISHGSDKTYRDHNFSKVKKQMRLEKSNDLSNFANCTLTHEKYIDYLAEKKIIIKIENPPPSA